ncbi:MAG: hypothetical protein E6I87_06220 [Chloroflexi bacterium]|nr:MAG: hypothetical protein E6I87_06220 [Chloroflexota bacterium]
MKVLVELSRPALAAAVGALAALLLTAIAGAPNVAVALAFFAAFFVASSVDLLLHGRLTPVGRWRSGGRATPNATLATARAGITAAPFDRFADRGKRVLALAQDEAIRMQHNYIGTEHVLLGIIRDGEGAGGRALAEAGVTLEQARVGVELTIGRGASIPSAAEITLTPRTKKVIELAIAESGHKGVGSGHLLLGVVREGEGIAAGILESMKVDPDALLRRTREKIAEGLD